MNNLKLLMLITWREEGKWSFYRSVKSRVKQLDLIQPFYIKGEQNSAWGLLSTYLAEFYIPIIAFTKRKQYYVIVSWSLRMGIWYGILNRFFGSRSAIKHIVYDFHINLTRNDLIFRLKILLLRLALPGIDFVFTTSTEETTIYSTMFQILPQRICFFPIPPPRSLLKGYNFAPKNYIFSYGNSDRDYDTLVQAVKNLTHEVIILSQTYQPSQPLPGNVRIIREKTVGLDLIELILAARMVVLPLKDYYISAGQTAMIEVMALGQILVVTSNMATVEYATHGETALFYKAGDIEDLQKNIRFVLDHPETAREMGKRARARAEQIPDQQVNVFCTALESLVS